jgi:multicomponent K+:H+ antiporter subunit E
MSRILPQPVVSLLILALWMALAPAMTIGQFLLGFVLAITIPWFTQGLWPDRPRMRNPLLAARLTLRVLADIIIANIEVARLVLGPLDRLNPHLIEIPLDIDDPFVATIFASIITLTPGTVSIDIDRRRRLVLVHVLNVTDIPDAIATMKRRYEAPLKEIFGC